MNNQVITVIILSVILIMIMWIHSNNKAINKINETNRLKDIRKINSIKKSLIKSGMKEEKVHIIIDKMVEDIREAEINELKNEQNKILKMLAWEESDIYLKK